MPQYKIIRFPGSLSDVPAFAYTRDDGQMVNNDPADPNYAQMVTDTVNFTINILSSDPYDSTYPDLRAVVREALHAINWAQKVADAQAGQALIDGLTNNIADIEAALTLLTVKPALVAYLTKQRNFDQGLLDEAVDNLIRWRKLLQAFTMTDDMTVP